MKESTLYVKSKCGYSRATLLAMSNLSLDEFVAVRNIDEDDDARAELKKLAGKEQTPCLIEDGSTLFESADIIEKWVAEAAGLS